MSKASINSNNNTTTALIGSEEIDIKFIKRCGFPLSFFSLLQPTLTSLVQKVYV
jgi:hypothetical protein